MSTKKHHHQEKPCCHQARPWYKEPLFLVIFLISFTFLIHLLFLSQEVGILSPFFQKFFGYVKITWWAIGLGLLIGCLIEILIPEELMANLLAKGKKSIFIAVLLGFLASACSHGILAIAVSLYKKGASTASTLAFLLAAPWANLAVTILLFSLFGAKAFLIVGGALLVAIISGFVFQIFEARGIIEGGKIQKVSSHQGWFWPGWGSLVQKMGVSIWSLTKMVVWWILLGFFVASALGTFVPEMVFHQFFGPTFLGMLATLALATVIEVCSEGSAPLAFELFQKTGAFGNAFIFLQAGVATDFTEIGIILTNIGRRAAFALILVTVPLILLLGYLLNNLLL